MKFDKQPLFTLTYIKYCYNSASTRNQFFASRLLLFLFLLFHLVANKNTFSVISNPILFCTAINKSSAPSKQLIIRPPSSNLSFFYVTHPKKPQSHNSNYYSPACKSTKPPAQYTLYMASLNTDELVPISHLKKAKMNQGASLNTSNLVPTIPENPVTHAHPVTHTLQSSTMIVISDHDEVVALRKSQPTTIILGTHDEKFHCDEVLGMVMLKSLRKYHDAVIVRSRNPNILKLCDVVIDVGHVYDPDTLKFDHHQKGFHETFDQTHNVTALSSAGLIYKHFGKEILQNRFGLEETDSINFVHTALYNEFIESIDASDNGVPISDTNLKYIVKTTLSDRVSRCNAKWNRPEDDQNELFKKAFGIVENEFVEQADGIIKTILPAKNITEKALEDRFNTHKSGLLIEFSGSLPFMEFVWDYEDANPSVPPILFALSPRKAKDGQNWGLLAMKNRSAQFSSRKSLPSIFCGLNGEDLNVAATKNGLNDILFVHKNGFIGVTKTKEAALALFDFTLSYSV